MQRMKHQIMCRVRCILFSLLLLIMNSFLSLQAKECLLDMTTPTSDWNGNGNWGGFLSNATCMRPFERYLYALAKRANTTGIRTAGEKVFLNTTEERVCLSTLTMNEENVFGCGILRLASGNGGCSDYTLTDVMNKLGEELRQLDQHCKNLGVHTDGECDSCLGAWGWVGGSANDTREVSDICRFTVLVSLTGQRVQDMGWIRVIYSCLGRGIPEANRAEQRKKRAFATGILVLIGCVGGISLLAAIVLLVLFKKRTGKRKTAPRGVEARGDLVSECYSSAKISLEEVHLATDNLSASNFIGQGVAGNVYKGVLSNGQHIAVKHIVNDGHMETFVREVTSLSHVKHPNLVELLGHCDGGEESFLVYELCNNGNLSEWLFGKDKFLTWTQRLEVALDSAKGLWFLHTYPEGCIVHRDIKPANILLSANFQAKLSDFGLSKVINKELSYVSSEVRGTFGYMDPEYQKNGHVHSSSDVYSFGVVLLQLLSGQRVINLEVTRPMPLCKLAKILGKGGSIAEFADPKLNGNYSSEAFQLTFKLALRSTGLKEQRPSMEKVVSVLHKALHISEKDKSLLPSFQLEEIHRLL